VRPSGDKPVFSTLFQIDAIEKLTGIDFFLHWKIISKTNSKKVDTQLVEVKCNRCARYHSLTLFASIFLEYKQDGKTHSPFLHKRKDNGTLW
jgi:hypothetical protein